MMKATILQNPRSPMTFDPPTRQSIQAAKAAADQERIAAQQALAEYEEKRRHSAVDVIDQLVGLIGHEAIVMVASLVEERGARWVVSVARNAAALKNSEPAS